VSINRGLREGGEAWDLPCRTKRGAGTGYMEGLRSPPRDPVEVREASGGRGLGD